MGVENNVLKEEKNVSSLVLALYSAEKILTGENLINIHIRRKIHNRIAELLGQEEDAVLDVMLDVMEQYNLKKNNNEEAGEDIEQMDSEFLNENPKLDLSLKNLRKLSMRQALMLAKLLEAGAEDVLNFVHPGELLRFVYDKDAPADIDVYSLESAVLRAIAAKLNNKLEGVGRACFRKESGFSFVCNAVGDELEDLDQPFDENEEMIDLSVFLNSEIPMDILRKLSMTQYLLVYILLGNEFVSGEDIMKFVYGERGTGGNKLNSLVNTTRKRINGWAKIASLKKMGFVLKVNS